MSGDAFLPYGRQYLDKDDEQAVLDALRSDYLTTGPRVEAFERALADFCGAQYAAAVSNGTAALHGAMFALGVGPGDEVIVPPMTFAATANCVAYMGATPVFADVDPETLLIDPASVEQKISPRTRGIIAVDFAGLPCDYDALRKIADEKELFLAADGCHAIGAALRGRPVGSLADLTVFSFHPVKHITSGEGGAVLSDDPRLIERLRLFRNHGITTDAHKREEQGTWFYEMVELGMNYRLTDIQCALGASQLKKLPEFLCLRRRIAARYDAAFAEVEDVRPLAQLDGADSAYHLYVVRVPSQKRSAVFKALRAANIGVNVHYIPVHLHPYYRKHFHTGPGLCPHAEAAYEEILSLPMFPAMTNEDVDRVVLEVRKALDDALDAAA
jgi:perosamine synthetase